MTVTQLGTYGIADARSRFHVPSPGLHEYLAEDIRSAWERVQELRRKRDDAMADVAVEAQRLNRAPKVDADAVAAAFGAGKPDPGPMAVPAAQKALADAERVARGWEQAAAVASVELSDLVRMHPEKRASIAALEDFAAEKVAECRAAIAAAQSARGLARDARQLSLWLDQWPNRVAQPRGSGRWSEVGLGANEDLAIIMEPVPAALGGPAEAPAVVW